MSSQFNYELDEKNIRSTLLNAKPSVLGESSWHEFEQNFSKKIVTHNPSSFKLPDFQLNINRNVILPVIFILGLVGISAIVISFIDFKSADEQQVEKKLEPNPENFKPKVSTVNPVITKTEIVKEETPQNIQVKKDSIQPTPSSLIQEPLLSKVSNVIDSSPAQVMKTDNEVAKINSDSNSSENINSTTVIAGDNVIVPQTTGHKIRRKKAEQIPAEQIETMKAPELIKADMETSEPELEIKID